MTPVMSWSPADYYTASRRAHRAWVATQAQQVIPGVLEEVDAKRAAMEATAAASASSSPPASPLHAAGGLDNPKGDEQ